MSFAPLSPGDLIALVAPASPFGTENFHRACRLIEARGFRVHCGKHLFHGKGYLCGTEAQRAHDLIHALTNPEISAVVCVKGGFGSGKLLPYMPLASLAKSPKPFVGYSDITFLHQALQSRSGWVTFHGPNLVDMSQRPEAVATLTETLQGWNEFEWDIHEDQMLRRGSARGTLRGGNLTCLCHLVGTPFIPDLKGAILFLEDRGEALYRLDRLMLHLKLAGHLETLAGLVLGQFTDCAEPSRIWEVMLDHTRAAGMPIVCNMPFGHSWPNDILPLGGAFILDTHARTFKAAFRPFDS